MPRLNNRMFNLEGFWLKGWGLKWGGSLIPNSLANLTQLLDI